MRNLVVILDVVDSDSLNPITIGVLDPKETQLIKQIEKILHRPIKPLRLNVYEIQKAIDIGYAQYEIHHEKLKLCYHFCGAEDSQQNLSMIRWKT